VAPRRAIRSAGGSRFTDSLTVASISHSHSGVFGKDTLIKGRPARIQCVEINEQVFTVKRGLVTTVALEDEWFGEVRDPEAVIAALRAGSPVAADVFTFCQRLPHVEPRFPYEYELESTAALHVQSYQHWWDKQIESSTRNKIRKSLKAGVEVRVCTFDDDFVRGMTSIFNETPIRQGRRFWHYGKDFATVKRDFSRFLHREELIGAYYRDELIGFVMLGKSTHFADLGQIISKIEHRDKAPTNALIAKAVEVCCARGIPHLMYAFWTGDGLGDFKRQSGFREVRLPRYTVPLTRTGKLAIRAGLNRPIKAWIPARLAASLKEARRNWYARTEKRASS
jgi:hypothetical protein